MTRFFVDIECEDIVKRLIKYCKKENYTCRVNEFGVVSYDIYLMISTLFNWTIYYRNTITNLYVSVGHYIDDRSTKDATCLESELDRNEWEYISGFPFVERLWFGI